MENNKIPPEEIEDKEGPKQFKEFLLSLYDSLPKSKAIYKGKAIFEDNKEYIPNQEFLKLLDKGKYIRRSSIKITEEFKDFVPKGTENFMLGSSAFPLISAWKNEEFTKRVISLTKWLILLGVVQVVLILLFALR